MAGVKPAATIANEMRRGILRAKPALRMTAQTDAQKQGKDLAKTGSDAAPRLLEQPQFSNLGRK
jgi:hypothetical protein